MMHETIRRTGWTAGMVLLLFVPAYAQSPRAEALEADSIVLERTRCYGTCPSYRLRLSAGGEVQFRSRDPLGSIHADTVPADGFSFLIAMAERIGFYDLPDRIEEHDPVWCPDYATDHPTFIGTIYGAAGRKRVVYYTGCYSGAGDHTVPESLGRLRQFLAAVDSVAGSSRWVRPAPFR
jgi:hypothetical protein